MSNDTTTTQTDTNLLTELQAKQRKFSKRKSKRNRHHKARNRQYSNNRQSYHAGREKHSECDPYHDYNAYLNAYPSNAFAGGLDDLLH